MVCTTAIFAHCRQSRTKTGRGMKVRIIKTQCGEMIVNVEKLESVGITRHSGFEDGKEYERFYVTAHKVADLGKYATETCAMEAQDLLTEWLTADRNCTELSARDFACFQMPQDGEGLDA